MKGDSMSENLSMAQIAKELQVSQRVVSAVINGNARKLRVGHATEERINQYIEERGFVRSKSALQFKAWTGSEAVCLLYCGKFIDIEHLVTALTLLTGDIKRTDHLVEICGVDPENLQRSLKEQVARGVQRMIWIHANPPEEEIMNSRKLYPLIRRFKKVVVYNYNFGESTWDNDYLAQGMSLVGFLRERSYREAAAIFAEGGHRAVALNEVWVGTSRFLSGNNAMAKAFQEAGLNVHGLQPEKARSHAELHDFMTEELVRLHKTEGVCGAFIRNDLSAATIIGQLHTRGFRVPEDIGIIGFDNSPYSAWLQTPLTTFYPPIEELCAKTLELVRSPDTDQATSHVLEPKLILRKSHGPVHFSGQHPAS